MQLTNVEVIRANNEAFSRKDVDAMIGFYAPDADVLDRRAPGWGDFHGRDAIRSYYQGLFDNVEDVHEQLEVTSEDGDVVIVTCHSVAHLTGQADAGALEFDYALRIVMRDGLIATMEIYQDAEAAAAAG